MKAKIEKQIQTKFIKPGSKLENQLKHNLVDLGKISSEKIVLIIPSIKTIMLKTKNKIV